MSIFNIKDFGTAGNGVDDNFPAFRAALDTIDAVNSGDNTRGAILFISSGMAVDVSISTVFRYMNFQ